MDSNDEIYDSAEESNSVSTDTKNERSSIKSEKVPRRSTNVIFVQANELECSWQSEDNKKARKSLQKSKVSKTPSSSKAKKKRGRPKRKKDSNPWSDPEDENIGLENEVSDDEYFRRLEESNMDNDNLNVLNSAKVENESVEDPDEFDEDGDDIYVKVFDPDNYELQDYIIAEREKSLYLDDKSKPEIEFPASSNDLNCPRNQILQLLSIYETVIQYSILLKLSPFKLEDFITSMVSNENSSLLSELHMSILKFLLREDEINQTALCSVDQKDVVNFAFLLMDNMTWPELLRLYTKAMDMEISPCYPFVTLSERIKVLTFVLDQFINCNCIKSEIAKEEITHEDFCRVCHEQGKVICCETCPAVYHFYCLTPPLPSLPETIWLCPICKKHQIDGLRDCNFDGEKATVEHKKTPLGTDRFGNTYWFVARRLIVEPRNDNIENLSDDIQNKNYEPDYEKVVYYSRWSSVEKLRNQLSKDWEEDLCDVFDSLVDEIRKSMNITINLTRKGMEKLKSNKKFLEKQLKVISVLDESISTDNSEITNNDENYIDELDSEPIQNCVLKTFNEQKVGLHEDLEGLLVRNIDGSAIRVRLSVKTRSNQLDEVASTMNYYKSTNRDCKNVFLYRLGDEGDWRYYKNLYVTEPEAISKLQHQEEKDKRMALSKKFSLNDFNEFQWYVGTDEIKATWKNTILPMSRPNYDITGGPLSMLQCIRLTMQNMEAQMFGSFMCPLWKSERKNWLINIQRTRSAANLAEFVAAFENAIRPCAFIKSWSTSIGFLELNRITVAEKEEEKRIKGLEKKVIKPDSDIIKTRNPGLLKHTLWKTKGEEYRRSGGDGWTWLSPTLEYNNVCLDTSIKIYNRCISENLDTDDIDVMNAENDYFKENLMKEPNNFESSSIDSLLDIREKEFDKVRNETYKSIRLTFDELLIKHESLITKKKELDAKLTAFSKSDSKIGNVRKRPFQGIDLNYSSQDKRSKYSDNYMSQYDGASDDDGKNESNTSTKQTVQIPTTNQNPGGNKPTILTNQNNMNRFCIVNIGQTGGGLNNTNRYLLNPRGQLIAPGQWPSIIRLPGNQLCKIIQTSHITNPTVPNASIINRNATGSNIANLRTTNQADQQHSQQFMYVNNISNISQNMQNGQLSNSIPQNSVVYNVSTCLPNQQAPIRLINNQVNPVGVPNQHYKRLVPNAIPNRNLMPNVNYVNPNNLNRMPVNVNQNRRIVNKVINNNDVRQHHPLSHFNNVQEQLNRRREKEYIGRQLLEVVSQLENLDIEIEKLKNKLKNFNDQKMDCYRIYQQDPLLNDEIKNKLEKSIVPFRNYYKWPNLTDEKFVSSIFLYNYDNLRLVILNAGRIDVPGFDSEKKRWSNVNWPYITARPSYGTTWRYQVSKIMQMSNLQNDLLETAITEPVLKEESIQSSGSSGLSSLALQLKMLWYSLRWDDMLTNWQDTDGNVTKKDEIIRETLPNGDSVERKMVKWRPLDLACSRVAVMLSSCFTSNAPDTVPVNSFGSSSNINGNSTAKRSSRRSRKIVSMTYTDTDYFTDDGERDSEDSDPNFIPGVSIVKTPKSRSRKSRTRLDDTGSESLPLEKVYIEEWRMEDELDLSELRDFLTRIQWKIEFIQLPRIYICPALANMMAENVFDKKDQNMHLFTPISSVNTTQPVIQPHPSVLSNVIPTDVSNVTGFIKPNMLPNITTQVDPSLSITNNSVASATVINSDTSIPELNNRVTSSSTSVPIDKPISSKSDVPKLIVESSSVAKTSVQVAQPTQQNIQSNVKINKPFSANLPFSQSSVLPTPITDIREVSKPNEVAPVLLPQSISTPIKSKGRGRGRGRPPLAAAPGISQVSESSISEEFNKYDDLKVDIVEASKEVDQRCSLMKQTILDSEVTKTMDKVEDIKKEAIKEINFSSTSSKKTSKLKKSSRDTDNSEDETTDPEIETGSTSPAIEAPVVKKQIMSHEKRNTVHGSYVSVKDVYRRRRSYSSDDKKSTSSEESDYEERRMIKKGSKRSFVLNKKSHKSNEASKRRKKEKREIKDNVTKKEHVSNEDESENQIYCSCRKIYDSTRMYIACDFCDEWYHPECVGLTDSEANMIEGEYKCPSCKEKERKAHKSKSGHKSFSKDEIDLKRIVDSNLKNILVNIVNKMIKHRDSFPLIQNVKIESNSKFRQVVKNPLDLYTVRENLERSKYKNLGSFKLDVQKIFSDCFSYFDDSSQEYKASKSLENYFMKKLSIL